MLRAIKLSLVAALVAVNPMAAGRSNGRESAGALSGRYLTMARNANDPTATKPARVANLLAEADAAGSAGNDVTALKAYDRVLAIEADNLAARAGRLLTMSRLGASSAALAEAKRFPQLPSDIVQRLHEDAAALTIRRSEQVYRARPIDARADADAALQSIEANLKRYPQSERSRFDYVRALNNRGRHLEAIALYETLLKEKRTLPGSLHQAAGNACLAEHRPDAAATAFKAALQADPNDFNAGVGLFYALSDLNAFDAARRHIDAFAARPWQPEQKFEAEVHAGWAPAFENRLGRAQAEFSALQTRAPASAPVHNALGQIYLWRGWPRRAEEEYLLVAQADKDDIGASAGLAGTDVALGDFRSAAMRVARLNALAPDAQAVKRATRAQALRNMHELTFAIGTSRTKDRSSEGRTLNLDGRLYGPPLGFQHRLFTHIYYERARFADGAAYYKRLGIGLESIVARHARIEAEVQQEFFRNGRIGGSVDGTFDVGDDWRVQARFDSDSIDVPLRARLNDVHGRAAQVRARYRLNERTAAEVGAQELKMSDTNTRRGAFATAHHKVIEGPVYQATAGIELGSSSNTLDNAAYFNPRRDRTLQIALDNEWLGYRRYARAFYQRVHIAVGSYAQQNFGNKTIGNVRYEHDWSLSDTAQLRYGIGYAWRAFDGTPSNGPEASLSWNWKF